MPIELTAHTDAGARLVAIAEELSEELAARAAEHDRDGTLPVRGDRRAQGRRLLRGARPRRARWARRLVRARPRRGVEPPGARRRLRRDRREHAPRRGAQHGAPSPGRGRGRGRAPRPRLRRVARADRPRRRRAGRRDQRARPGPHAAGHARHPHRVRLADRRPQAVLHHVPRRHRSLRGRHLRRRRGHRALRVRDGAHRRARRRGPRRLGRARDARLRQQLDLARGRRAARVRRARRLPSRRPAAVHGAQPGGRAVPRRGLARHRRVGRRRSPAAASPGASTAMRARACRWPTTPSTSPPRAASCRARPR